MEDSSIVYNYLTHSYPDSHQAIYLYVHSSATGYIKTKNTTINKIIADINIVFSPSFNENELRSIIREFLEQKRKNYLLGNVKVKAIY